MRNYESVIARILLLGYLLIVAVPALPAEGLSLLGFGKVTKVCKRSYVEVQENQKSPLQLTFSAAENAMNNIPQLVVTLFCGSTNIHLPSPLTGELPSKKQQEPSFAAFVPSYYSILFQELDPDPPKAPLS